MSILPPPADHVRGIVYRLIGISCYGCMGATIKLAAAGHVGVVEQVFYRNLFAFPVVLFAVARSGGWSAIATARPAAHLLRGSLGFCSMVLAFLAVMKLPLAQATAIGFAAPLFATMLSAMILRETVGWHRWGAILIGFVGVLVMMRPGGSPPSMGHLVALASALSVGLVTITIRQIGATDGATATVFWFTSFCAVASGIAMPFVAGGHAPATWLWLVLIGLFGGGAQFMMTQSLRLAPVSVVAPIDYAQVVWSIALGWLIWRDALNGSTAIGTALVVAGGLYTVHANAAAISTRWRPARRRRSNDSARDASPRFVNDRLPLTREENRMSIQSPSRPSPPPARSLGISADLLERAMLVIMLSTFAIRMAVNLHPGNVLIVLSESFTVALVLIRRPGAIAPAPYAWMIALAGTFMPLLVGPGGASLVSATIGTPMMIGGLLISILAKIFLNRSFGIVAANRGVKSSGPYRLVRHPMYLGYLIVQIGFLLMSFTVANLMLYVAAWSAQLLRIREEERFLSQDPLYRAYAEKVRYRIIPGLF